MSLGAVAVRGGALVLSGQVIKVILLLIGAAVLGRVLGPEEFGLIAMVTVITGLGELFRDFGLSSAAIQAKSLNRSQMSNLFWINSGLGLFLASCATLFAPLVGDMYGDSRIPEVMVVISAAFVFSGIQTQFQVDLTRRLMFPALIVSEVVSQALGLAVAIGLALAGFGYWSIALQPVAYAAILCIIRCVWSPWKPGWPTRTGGTLIPLLRFGWNLGIAQLLNYISLNSPTLIIGTRFGPTDAGLYSRLYQLVGAQMNQILAPLTNAVFPVLSRIDSDRRYNAAIRRINIPVSYAMVFGLIFVATNSRPFVELVLGDGWSGGSAMLSIVSIGLVFQSFTFVGYWVFLSKGISGSLLRYNLVTKSVALSLAGFGAFQGALGVAFGYALGLALAWPICWWWLGRVGSIESLPIFVEECRVIIVISVCALVGKWATNLINFESSLASLLISGSVMLATAIFISAAVPVVRADRRAMKEIIALFREGRGNATGSSL
ncbi:lipopolysaccharide biosynthesis protein [Rhodococcus opacus]|uniref:lipopolysaccharide biosynthesis protein n=1 Tax=Rhodococcus opacus TaxID=37919 RepID=UPI000FFB78CB|nr:lipopolysaccharide biosynthesis protein [Rhodococcus opacus]